MKRPKNVEVTVSVPTKLTPGQQEELKKRLKCAVLLALPERLRYSRIVLQPKVPSPTGD